MFDKTSRQMKVLYAAFRHDPRDPDAASGADYNFYGALARSGFDVRLVGPFREPASLPERALKRLHRLHSRRRYPKYDLTNTWRASRALDEVDKAWDPDVIFTLYPAPLAMYTGDTPCIFRTDTTFLGMHDQGAEFLQHGRLALALCVWEERKAFHHCAKVITHSDWSRDVLMSDYSLGRDQIEVLANPSALPSQAVPDSVDVMTSKRLEVPLRLLLVGRDYRRKGVDIAIEVTNQLNQDGTPAQLTVCATSGPECSNVTFVGPYRKTDHGQLRKYVELYERAHFLLHPARFDASPIVTAEAAAFGVPTVTNASGGLATSVKHGESGVVLPRHSPPKAYAEAIAALVSTPDRYYDLCRRTRRRYQRELNWDVTGERVAATVREVAERAREG
jgi:glycosyltransferase involved in cell wall biosynthesis